MNDSPGECVSFEVFVLEDERAHMLDAGLDTCARRMLDSAEYAHLQVGT
ncbi:MAG: hypothetical protein GY811_19635 [Myxococcales bacterium]|nr:hypothetical protein [Myxococcales bacterium]